MHGVQLQINMFNVIFMHGEQLQAGMLRIGTWQQHIDSVS